jgi:hypothetical protein
MKSFATRKGFRWTVALLVCIYLIFFWNAATIYDETQEEDPAGELMNPTEPQRALAEYAKMHKQITSGNLPPKFLAVVPSWGIYTLYITRLDVGLGNQVEQIMYCFLVAFLEKRAFFVKTDASGFQYQNFFDFDERGINWIWTEEIEKKGSSWTTVVSDGIVGDRFTRKTFWEQQLVVMVAPNMMELPINDLYQNPSFKDLIPKALGEWKSEVLHFLFQKLNPRINNKIDSLKQKIGGNFIGKSIR